MGAGFFDGEERVDFLTAALAAVHTPKLEIDKSAALRETRARRERFNMPSRLTRDTRQTYDSHAEDLPSRA